MIGHILDNRYKILEKVGTGGMASVYKAQDILLDRIVAVKILHSKYGNDHDFVVRFRQEAQAAAKLSHPNIVNIYDVGYDENVHFIVMEFVRGETLKEYIEKHGHLPINTSIQIAFDIGEALENAHANGIVHCDIKPHNILVTETGRIKVADFGPGCEFRRKQRPHRPRFSPLFFTGTGQWRPYRRTDGYLFPRRRHV